MKNVLAKELLDPINLLSLSRIPLAAIAAMVFNNKIAFFSVLIIAGITDLIDGPLAKKYGSSKNGTAIDATADKLAVGIFSIFLLATARIEIWQFLVLTLRDMIMALMSLSVLLRKDLQEVIRKNKNERWLGKIATAGQLIAIFWLALGLQYFSHLMIVLGAVSAIALVDFIISFNKSIKK